ncbi:hypothetical protein [Myceligenerans salitolerans]|uniref:Uncharacterized protein n=1 Tax=Myceligenerans salitolerans TaxID=1230528 RepID=A0ABS3ICH6_9MICO|nr:hypothetical protein [Myceligenerans salitolerans]MBO0610732.1 hypothetical protein [Myceligenerans salitolerans]
MGHPHGLDLATRKFWRLVGHPVDLAGAESWLRAPVSDSPTVADGWPAAEAAHHGGTADDGDPDAGLLAAVAALDGPGFDASVLRPEIRDFYEHTSAWRMDVWTGWSPPFWPAGELIARLFGRRVEQLALPMRPLDVAHGMDSRITVIRDRSGAQVSAAWLRTLRSTGRYVFSGCYTTRLLPGADRPSIHVAFPLESGNVQVFLRPRARGDGSLVLESPPGRFGQDGAYVVVRDGGRDHAARVPLHETFHVYADADGVLRTDHELRLGRAWVVRLHYRLERLRRPAAAAEEHGAGR